MGASITSICYALPDGSLTHDELRKRFGSDEMDRLIQTTGIKNRRVSLNNECASDLATKAALKMINENNIDPKSIDFIIFSTQMPDYLLPTTACIIQHKLGIPTSAGAIDINLGCSQYLYAHSCAFAYIKSGLAKKVLVMTGDTPSRIINKNDRSVVPLFGDAGTAAIIEPNDSDEDGYIDFVFGTDGEQYDSLIWPASGMRGMHDQDKGVEEKDKFGSVRSAQDMYMDGQRIFLFTLKRVPETLKEFLIKHKLTADDIDFFIFHQASKFIIDSISKKMKIPEDKFNRVYADRGNSGGSTVGIALHDAISNRKIKQGDVVVLSAFGVGLSWSHALYKVTQNDIKSSCID